MLTLLHAGQPVNADLGRRFIGTVISHPCIRSQALTFVAVEDNDTHQRSAKGSHETVVGKKKKMSKRKHNLSIEPS